MHHLSQFNHIIKFLLVFYIQCTMHVQNVHTCTCLLKHFYSSQIYFHNNAHSRGILPIACTCTVATASRLTTRKATEILRKQNTLHVHIQHLISTTISSFKWTWQRPVWQELIIKQSLRPNSGRTFLWGLVMKDHDDT